MKQTLAGLLLCGIAAVTPTATGQEYRAASNQPASDTRYGAAQVEYVPEADFSSLPPGGLTAEQVRMIVADQIAAEEQRKAAEKQQGHVVGSDLSMRASWRNGLEIESAHKDFRVHVGGRTQLDSIWLQGDDGYNAALGPFAEQDAVDFRRARLRVDGVMYETLEWAAEFDFANSVNDNAGLVGGLPAQPASEANVAFVTAPTDLWFTFTHVPFFGNIRIGNYKEPIGLEHLTSSRFLDFMERSFLQDAYFGPFNNGFSPGIGFFNWSEEERATWAFGVFKNTTNVFAYGVGDGEGAMTGRFTFLPYYDEPSQGRYLLHLGSAFSIRDPNNGIVRQRSRASLRNGPAALNPVLADTGNLFASEQNILAAEGALVWGPWLFQSEYVFSELEDAATAAGVPLGGYYTHGYYVETLYFLTGEHREYDRKLGAFGRVIPYNNAFWVPGNCFNLHGHGAWQLAARYSWLDLANSGVDAGVIEDTTLGVNWFLNPNMKIQFNYVYTRKNDGPAIAGTGDGESHGFGMRVAHDF